MIIKNIKESEKARMIFSWEKSSEYQEYNIQVADQIGRYELRKVN